MIIRVFMPSSIEQLFIVDKHGISFFIFNLFYLIYFIFSPKTHNRKNIIITSLFFIQWFISIIASIIVFDYPNILNFIFTCQNIFVIPIIYFWAPLSKKQIDFLKWPLLITFFYLSLQIILYSTGILKFNFGENEHYYGNIMRIANTTIGGVTGTSVFLFILGSIIFDNYIKANKQTLFLFIWSIPIFFTVSRGGIFAIIFFSLYVFFKKTANKIFFKKIGYILFFSSIIILLFKLGIFDPIIERTEIINYYSNDFTAGRTDRFEFAYNEFKDSPIFGNGIATIYTPAGANVKVAGPSPHNFWLTILAEQGIIGFSLEIIIFIMILLSINKHSYSFVSMLIIMFILMNVECIFIHDEYYTLLFLFIIIAQKKQLINKNKIQ